MFQNNKKFEITRAENMHPNQILEEAKLVREFVQHLFDHKSAKTTDWTFKLHSLAKAGGMIASIKPNPFSKSQSFVFFPEPADSEFYYLAGRHSVSFGPADSYPGSVGTTCYQQSKKQIQISELQSSVNHNKCIVQSDLDQNYKGQNLKKKYAHWQDELLSCVFDIANRSNLDVRTHATKKDILTRNAKKFGFNGSERSKTDFSFTFSKGKAIDLKHLRLTSR